MKQRPWCTTRLNGEKEVDIEDSANAGKAQEKLLSGIEKLGTQGEIRIQIAF